MTVMKLLDNLGFREKDRERQRETEREKERD
jgi:hypothetical protein